MDSDTLFGVEGARVGWYLVCLRIRVESFRAPEVDCSPKGPRPRYCYGEILPQTIMVTPSIDYHHKP